MSSIKGQIVTISGFVRLLVVCVCAQLCLTLCDPMDYIQSMEFSRPEHWSV